MRTSEHVALLFLPYFSCDWALVKNLLILPLYREFYIILLLIHTIAIGVSAAIASLYY